MFDHHSDLVRKQQTRLLINNGYIQADDKYFIITVIKLLNYTCSISTALWLCRHYCPTRNEHVTESFWYYHHSVRWNCPERLSASSWSSAPCAGSSSLFAFKGHTLKQRVFLSPKKLLFKHAVKNDLLGILSWNFTYTFWGHQRLILHLVKRGIIRDL